jgi:hypothetical protein
MLKSPQFTRSAVIAATIVSLGASPAVARQADMPVRPSPATSATQHGRHWTQARVDGIGVRPAGQPVAASPAPAEPLTRATQPSGGADWLLIAIGSTAMVALLLAVAVLPTRWLRARPFRARQV